MNAKTKQRLDEIRQSILAENVSYGELAELQAMSDEIPEDDLLLREWAGIPEHPEETSERDIATCGSCGLSWNDAIVTGYTPAPSARCPFEAFHQYDRRGNAKRLKPSDIPADFPVRPIAQTAA